MCGSAAKLEICYRTLYAVRGLPCPLWRAGIAPDIEAMMQTEETWLANYHTLQCPG